MNGIEIFDDRFAALVLPNAPLERLADGFRWLEGPVWFGDQDCLIFSDLPNDRMMRWSERSGLSVFRQPSAFANGHCRDQEGRLVSCSHLDRRLTRTELDGTVNVLAASYGGKRLNSPNDVVCRSDGGIWFTDPLYGLLTDYEGGKGVSEAPPCLYRCDPVDGSLLCVADDFEGPNGLAFSPDERILYVAETGAPFARHPRQLIRAFDVSADGRSLSRGRDFCKISPGFADGFKVDEAGNLWCSAADGVHCLDPSGTLMGKILVSDVVANLVFGGRGRSRLFICASQTLYAIYTNTRGAVRP